METQDWKANAKNILKSELARKGVDYETLATKLKELGIEENYNSINTKINRGSFTFQFFLQCMKAIGVNEIRIN
ncbi:DUF6471 domain-containing protein [Nitrosomonas sp. sh817]|uniref:DUF6471 domain-containing protein n=1 Tax=Nitrosomonas sp. sh817 TaxID=3070658 RepID=UPI0027DDF2E5|nr:DUF6471 domain-containing protein [Nitrosomonas sp. sh817]WMJ09670.1 DUF6471 domain-containing protein [Nitrosomonas sp. sh817]